MTNDGATDKPNEVHPPAPGDGEPREPINSRSVFEFIFSAADLERAVVAHLPPEVAALATVTFACFDEDREYDWFEDDVRVDFLHGGGRYVFTASDVRDALTQLLLPAMRDRYRPVDIWVGRSGSDGGCARCFGADWSDHVHVQYVIRRELATSHSQRNAAWEAVKYAELLDDAGLIDRNVRGLEMIRDGAAPSSIAFHLIGRLAVQTVASLNHWSHADRDRVGSALVGLAMSTPQPFFQTSMEAFRDALAS